MRTTDIILKSDLSDLRKDELLDMVREFVGKEKVEPNPQSLEGMIRYLTRYHAGVPPVIDIDVLGNFHVSYVVDYEAKVHHLNNHPTEEDERFAAVLPYPIEERLSIRIGFDQRGRYRTQYFVRNCDTFCRIAFRDGVPDQEV